MISILVSAAVALILALLGTPLFIRLLVRRNYGQFIRQDGPTAHFTKRGTPTMGGVVIIAATVVGYFTGNLATGRMPNVRGSSCSSSSSGSASSASSTTTSRSPGSGRSG
jgi:Phospho-N-acetylmuramoyl-pentapeptide-transferase (EC 2.7.8.13)